MRQSNANNIERISEELVFQSENGFYRVQRIDSAPLFDSDIQELDTPHDHSCMFWGIVLGLLLPHVHNINQFKETLNIIFGEQPDFVANPIYNLLSGYSGNIHDLNPNRNNAAEMLRNLINNILRKKVSDYLNENSALISTTLPNVDVINRSREILQDHVWGDDIELLALSLMFNIRIEVIRLNGRYIFNPSCNDPSMLQLRNINQQETDSNTGHFHFLLNRQYLNNAIRENLRGGIDETHLANEPTRQASTSNRALFPLLSVEQIKMLLNSQRTNSLAYISNEQKINQTLDYLIQLGIKLSYSIGFERIRQLPMIKHPANFVLNKKFAYLSGFVLQAASTIVTDNSSNVVAWLSAVATLLGANGYSFLKTIEVTNNNYKDIQEAVKLAQLLYNNPSHRANLTCIFLPAFIHNSINTLLSAGLLWGTAWSLTNEPYKTIGKYIIFSCILAFVFSHMLLNGVIKNARSPIQDNLDFIRLASAFELAQYYHTELESYSRNEQYVIQRLFFQNIDLALYFKNQHLSLAQSLWLLSMLEKVFNPDDMLRLQQGHLIALLDVKSPFNIWLNTGMLSKKLFMRINTQHLAALSAYFSLNEEEVLIPLTQNIIRPLLKYLQTQPQRLTISELKVIIFAVANKFAVHEIKACQLYSEAVYQWHIQHLPPNRIQCGLNILNILAWQPEQLAAINYDASLLDILSTHIEGAKLLNTDQLIHMRSRTNYRRLLEEGKLTLTDSIIEDSERLSILNQLDSGLLTRFNQQAEYTIADLLAFIQEEAENIKSFNQTYSVNIQQLLDDMKDWNEPSQNDNVAINVHSPASPTNN
jgi:hypothetical protein